MITESRARELAFCWHSGKSSPLYQFGSAGHIDGEGLLLGEVGRVIAYIVGRLEAGKTGRGELREVQALRRFIEWRGPVAGR